MDADELVRRYAAGERDFTRAKLNQAVLIEANLKGAGLEGANLEGADLERAGMKRAILPDGKKKGPFTSLSKFTG